MRGVNDQESLLAGNLSLAASLSSTEEKLDETKDQLAIEKERNARNQRLHENAKRKAANCDELRKKQKAAHQQVEKNARILKSIMYLS